VKDNMETVNRSELVARVAARTEVTHNTVNAILGAALEEVQAAVEQGERVTLVGFGTFEGRARNARTARNPHNGEPIQVDAKTAPAFKAAVPFKQRVANAAAQRKP
jgi:DNA-binding protein HU-beta